MVNKNTEFEKHPAVIFLKRFIASISARIKEHSLEDSMYSLTLTTVTGAGRLKSFLEEKVIQYDDDRTYFLINLDSIPQEFLMKTTKDAKQSPRDILVNLLRNNGFEPKTLSSKKLLGNEIRLHGNGVIRLDFFDKKAIDIMVSIIKKAGFDIQPSPNNDPYCYLVTLEKENAKNSISFTPTFIKKLLEDKKLPRVSSFGNEEREGYPRKLRGYYFKNTEDRNIVFDFLTKAFPDGEFIKSPERTILINDPNRLIKGPRNKNSEKISKTIPDIENDQVKSSVSISNPEKDTLKIANSVKTTKEVQKTKKFTDSVEKFEKGFIEDLQQLMKKYDLIPKIAVIPRGVLIPDSIDDEITLPSDIFVGLGKDGLTLNTKKLKEYFKKIK
jgi:hypothetical protein